jgi:hypothetical protein
VTRFVPDPEFGPSTCRDCGAAIVWALTDTGRRQPVDLSSNPQGEVELFCEYFPDGSPVDSGVQRVRRRPAHRPSDSPAWTVHWATCTARRIPAALPAGLVVGIERAIARKHGPLFARLSRWWRREG